MAYLQPDRSARGGVSWVPTNIRQPRQQSTNTTQLCLPRLRVLRVSGLPPLGTPLIARHSTRHRYMLRMASILHAIEESMPELAGVETEANIASQDDVQLVIDDDAELESDLVSICICTLHNAYMCILYNRQPFITNAHVHMPMPTPTPPICHYRFSSCRSRWSGHGSSCAISATMAPSAPARSTR